MGIKVKGYARGVALDGLVTRGSGGGGFAKVLWAGVMRLTGEELS